MLFYFSIFLHHLQSTNAMSLRLSRELGKRRLGQAGSTRGCGEGWFGLVGLMGRVWEQRGRGLETGVYHVKCYCVTNIKKNSIFYIPPHIRYHVKWRHIIPGLYKHKILMAWFINHSPIQWIGYRKGPPFPAQNWDFCPVQCLGVG